MKKLPKNTGFFRLSSGLPLGGDFVRAAKDLTVIKIIRKFPLYKGCNAEVEFDGGVRAAVNLKYLKEG